mgnify:CR=1 FL=1|tara:strand:- start:1036 stop:2547 length:1512 start_codon:yes stop_codon:yes gene_type:complete
MPPPSPLKFRDGFAFADIDASVAEEDANLAQYYVAKERFVDRAVNREDNASVFIGPKGVGKSAILEMVRSHAAATGNESRLIEIAPDDLAFNALVNIESRTPLLQSASQSQWLFTSLWDFVLCAEILHREKRTYNAIERIVTAIVKDRDQRQRDKLLALTLDDSGKQLSLTDKMLALVDAIEMEGGYENASLKARVEIRDPQERSDDLRLLQLIANVAKQLPRSIEHDYFVLIDDLDLHWQGTPLQNAFLAAMFLSIRKMSRESTIKFVASLRKNIYREVTLEERDKFAPYVCEVSWSRDDIKRMSEKRMSFALNVAERSVWGRLFPESAFDFIWDNTDGMPREVLRLTVMCVEQAIRNGESSVSPDSINLATRLFSESRRDELASLHQFRYPNLGLVLRQFLGQRKEFDASALQEVGMKITDLVERNQALADLDWATAGFEDPVSLGRPLLDAGFLMIKDGRSAVARLPSDDDIQLLDCSKWYSIHPMYHAGLGLDGYNTYA